MGRRTVTRKRTKAERQEDRRRLRLERPVVKSWRNGFSIEALAERFLVPVEWVEQTIRRYERGGLILYPEHPDVPPEAQ